MFPGANASVYHNEAGEPLGWDTPDDDGPYDPDAYLMGDYDDQEPDDDDDEGDDEHIQPPTQDGMRAWLGDVYAQLTPGQFDDVMIAARDLAGQYGPDQRTEYDGALSEFVQALIGDDGHDYEPGEHTHPMHTDPDCRICGGRKH
ncbi:MAG TPA: hypothetical protein VF516_18755 [Kofleriaceae bacterium]